MALKTKPEVLPWAQRATHEQSGQRMFGLGPVSVQGVGFRV